MAATLKVRTTKTGDSRVKPDRIVIRPSHHPRTGWNQQFKAMAARGDDQLLDAPTPTEWEQDDWKWHT